MCPALSQALGCCGGQSNPHPLGASLSTSLEANQCPATHRAGMGGGRESSVRSEDQLLPHQVQLPGLASKDLSPSFFASFVPSYMVPTGTSTSSLTLFPEVLSKLPICQNSTPFRLWDGNSIKLDYDDHCTTTNVINSLSNKKIKQKQNGQIIGTASKKKNPLLLPGSTQMSPPLGRRLEPSWSELAAPSLLVCLVWCL